LKHIIDIGNSNEDFAKTDKQFQDYQKYYDTLLHSNDFYGVEPEDIFKDFKEKMETAMKVYVLFFSPNSASDHLIL